MKKMISLLSATIMIVLLVLFALTAYASATDTSFAECVLIVDGVEMEMSFSEAVAELPSITGETTILLKTDVILEQTARIHSNTTIIGDGERRTVTLADGVGNGFQIIEADKTLTVKNLTFTGNAVGDTDVSSCLFQLRGDNTTLNADDIRIYDVQLKYYVFNLMGTNGTNKTLNLKNVHALGITNDFICSGNPVNVDPRYGHINNCIISVEDSDIRLESRALWINSGSTADVEIKNSKITVEENDSTAVAIQLDEISDLREGMSGTVTLDIENTAICTPTHGADVAVAENAKGITVNYDPDYTVANIYDGDTNEFLLSVKRSEFTSAFATGDDILKTNAALVGKNLIIEFENSINIGTEQCSFTLSPGKTVTVKGKDCFIYSTENTGHPAIRIFSTGTGGRIAFNNMHVINYESSVLQYYNGVTVDVNNCIWRAPKHTVAFPSDTGVLNINSGTRFSGYQAIWYASEQSNVINIHQNAILSGEEFAIREHRIKTDNLILNIRGNVYSSSGIAINFRISPESTNRINVDGGNITGDIYYTYGSLYLERGNLYGTLYLGDTVKLVSTSQFFINNDPADDIGSITDEYVAKIYADGSDTPLYIVTRDEFIEMFALDKDILKNDPALIDHDVRIEILSDFDIGTQQCGFTISPGKTVTVNGNGYHILSGQNTGNPAFRVKSTSVGGHIIFNNLDITNTKSSVLQYYFGVTVDVNNCTWQAPAHTVLWLSNEGQININSGTTLYGYYVIRYSSKLMNIVNVGVGADLGSESCTIKDETASTSGLFLNVSGDVVSNSGQAICLHSADPETEVVIDGGRVYGDIEMACGVYRLISGVVNGALNLGENVEIKNGYDWTEAETTTTESESGCPPEVIYPDSGSGDTDDSNDSDTGERDTNNCVDPYDTPEYTPEELPPLEEPDDSETESETLTPDSEPEVPNDTPSGDLEPEHSHTEEIIPGKAASCTEAGLTDGKKCATCGEILVAQTELPAKGHTEETVLGRAATCTEAGLTDGKKCTACGKITVEQTEIAAKGHTPADDDGDCTTAVKCTACGTVTTEAKAEHTYGDWVVTKEPTTTEKGEKTKTCSVCGKKITEEIPVKVEDTTPEPEDTRPTEPSTEQKLAYIVNSDGVTCMISGRGTVTGTEIAIPSKIDGYTVVAIGNGAFEKCSDITGIRFPDTLETVGGNAFRGCSALQSIEIPASVNAIGSYAFEGCSGLTSITVKKGNPVYHSDANCLVETESKTLILGCRYSAIPGDGSVTSIGESAFKGCVGLTRISVPDSVTAMGWSAFSGCTGLSNVTLGAGLESIGTYAFSGCTSLEKITVPENIENIGSDAFGNCTKLKEVIVLGSDIIGTRAFENCTSLQSIVIPENISKIGSSAFKNCINLENVYYGGTESKWSKISVESENAYVSAANRYYYSEQRPENLENSWHFVNKVPTPWDKSGENDFSHITLPADGNIEVIGGCAGNNATAQIGAIFCVLAAAAVMILKKKH